MNATSFINAAPEARGAALGPGRASGAAAGRSLSTFRGAAVTYGEFRPPEVERMIGFPHALQRLWRCRGHLDERPRYATALYSSLEVAELFVRHRLSTYSVPPPESRDIGREAGRLVLFHAVSKFEGACEVRGPLSAVAEFSVLFSRTDAVAAELCKVDAACGRFLCSEDGNDFHFGDFSAIDLRSGTCPAFAFLDLEAMGARLARSAGRALITIELPPSTSSSRGRKAASAAQRKAARVKGGSRV